MKKSTKIRTYAFVIDECAVDWSELIPQFNLDLEFEIIDGYPAKTQADPDDCYPEQPTEAHFLGYNFDHQFDYEYKIFSDKFKIELKKYIENNIINQIEQDPENWFELDD